MMTVVKEFFDGINDLVMLPMDMLLNIVNNIGVQRIAALSSLMVYLYMEVTLIPVPPGFFGLMTTLNGLHAAKSIYGKGIEKGANGAKKQE